MTREKKVSNKIKNQLGDLNDYQESQEQYKEEKKPLDDVFLSWVWSLIKRFFKKWGENTKWVNLGIGYFVFFFCVTTIPKMTNIETKNDFYFYLLGLGVLTFIHTIWVKEVLIKMHTEEHSRELQKKVIELEQKLQSHDMYLAMKKEQQ